MTSHIISICNPHKKLKICFITMYNFAQVQPVSLANLCLASSVYHSELNNFVEMQFCSFDNSVTSIETITQEILENSPDVLIMGCYVWNEDTCKKIADIIKRKTPEIGIWMGGVNVLYSTAGFSENYEGVDIFVRGEGEDIIRALINVRLRVKENSSFINEATNLYGVSSHDSFNLKIDERLVVDLEKTYSPYLAYDRDQSLFDAINGDYKYLFTETSRGCVYSCAFCSFDSQKLGFRHYPLERFEEEIKIFCRKNVEQIFFCDAIFGGKKNNAKRLLKIMEANRPMYKEGSSLNDTFLYAYFRPEMLDEEFCSLLKETRFSMVQLGIQTVNPDVDRCMRRNDTTKITENMPILRLNKVPFQIDMIVGFPGDTLEGFIESLKFVIEVCRPSNFRAYTLAINPGTPLEDLAHSKGSEWLTYHAENKKVLSTYSFDEQAMNEMLSIGDVFVGLYDYLVDANAAEEKYTLSYFISFYEYIKDTDKETLNKIVKSHQYNDKSELFSSSLKIFDNSIDSTIDYRRVIYGKRYTRGVENEIHS